MNLTYDDLIWLHENKMTLRAVTNYKVAEAEKNNGGYGDAITLATFAAFIQPGHMTFPRDDVMGYVNQYLDISSDNLRTNFFTFLLLSNADRVPIELKSKLVQEMEMAIKFHIENALSERASSFVLLESDKAHEPYDIGKSYLTGKVGKHAFSQDKVKAIIDCDQQYDDLRGSWLNKNKIDTTVVSVVDAVINQIQTLRKAAELNQQNEITNTTTPKK